MEGTHFTIFLIDDDSAVLTSLGRLLQAAGYPSKAYLSAETFLSEHDASVPGCAVLDHAMPGLNGLDVQKALARQGIHRPVIFLTGQGTIPESVEAMRAGAVDYLTKPVDKVELLSAIRLAEERDKTQRDVEARNKIILQRLAKLTRRERETREELSRAGPNDSGISLERSAHMSAFGPKRTSLAGSHMSAFGGKADIKMRFATFSANPDTAPAFDHSCCARISSDSRR